MKIMSMTLEEAIKHAEEVANDYKGMIGDYALDSEKLAKCANEHKQLAVWLRELQERRKALGVITCGECRHFEDSSLSGYCNNPETYAIKTDADFGCILGERRTDS